MTSLETGPENTNGSEEPDVARLLDQVFGEHFSGTTVHEDGSEIEVIIPREEVPPTEPENPSGPQQP